MSMIWMAIPRALDLSMTTLLKWNLANLLRVGVPKS
jgi:hypothetical protein